MQTTARWIGAGCAVWLALAAQGCGDDTSSTSSATSSSSTAAATGGSGGTTSSGGGGEGGGGEGGGGGTGGSGGAGGGTPGGPFTSKGEASYEAQTSVAADTNGGVVAVWIGFFADFSSAIGYAVSRDGGATWTPPAYIASPDGRLASNPVVAVDSQGRFSLVWAGFRADGTGPDEHIYVSRLDNGTETFGAPAIASDDGSETTLDFDKPSIAIDADDNLLITWADFTFFPAKLTLARSTDGATFTRSTITEDDTFGNLASLCLDTALGPTAPLYLVHLGANGTVTLRRSTDQGMGWELLSTPAALTVFQDITCAVQGSDLWITYAAGDAPFVFGENTPGDAVFTMHSGNGGDTFDAPVQVSDGVMGDLYLFPRIVRAPSGALAVVYYQGQVAEPASFTLASSADGAAWTTSTFAMPGTFTLNRTIASWLGDYVGLSAPTAQGFVTYTENSENVAHIGFAAFAVP